MIRPARAEDYEPVCALFAEVDAFHAAARPDVIRVPEAPVHSREFIGHIMSSHDDLLLVTACDASPSGLVARIRVARIRP